MLTPEAYDKIVYAELPDSDTNTYLYSLVTTHLVYGPSRDIANLIIQKYLLIIHPYLLSKFEYYINFEVYPDINIYKCIWKRHDKIAFFIHTDDPTIEINKIKEYQSARWVYPLEASCSIFDIPTSEMIPIIFQL